jgi:hypothetical protein
MTSAVSLTTVSSESVDDAGESGLGSMYSTAKKEGPKGSPVGSSDASAPARRYVPGRDGSARAALAANGSGA